MTNSTQQHQILALLQKVSAKRAWLSEYVQWVEVSVALVSGSAAVRVPNGPPTIAGRDMVNVTWDSVASLIQWICPAA